MSLNQKQLAAVRYYEGDVQGDDPFYGDPKAYVTINSLFYPGISTEERRAKEGKRLNPAVTENPQRLYDFLVDLLSAFKEADISCERNTYRVERLADYEVMRQDGCTVSFTSTSTDGFLRSYADRIGIALMQFHIPAGIPCFPFLEMLKEGYLKASEREILLPPGLNVSFSETDLSEEEKTILDAEGNPPVLKCHALVTGIRPMENEKFDPEDYTAFAGVSRRVYEKLERNEEPDQADVSAYVLMKRKLTTAALSALRG